MGIDCRYSNLIKGAHGVEAVRRKKKGGQTTGTLAPSRNVWLGSSRNRCQRPLHRSQDLTGPEVRQGQKSDRRAKKNPLGSAIPERVCNLQWQIIQWLD